MWELIRINKRNSFILLAVMAVVLLALGYVIAFAAAGNPQAGILGVAIAFIIWVIMLISSYYGGSSILLSASHAQKITREVHPQLFNVVEEMTIAANLPKMPDIYIINDPGLNAFATGRDPQHAAVAVTAGLLAKLNRDELQGVIAHEISHILHRDILFVTVAGVALGAIVMISHLFLRGAFRSGTRRSRYSSSKGGGQAQLIMILVAIVCAILAPLFAQLLYFALSRRREYLADAGAARLTRYPEGLADALQKIADHGPQVATANQATAPMYIINPLTKEVRLSAWTSTHPPIQERIRILRNMMHGVSFQDYSDAYRQTTQSRDSLPAALLAESTPAARRETPAAPADTGSGRPYQRQLGDLRWQLNHFGFLACDCGLKLKIPPHYSQPIIACPRCKKPLKLADASPRPLPH